MPSERTIIESLNRSTLADLVAHFELDVQDRRVRGALVSALAASRRARIDAILERLPLTALKAICKEHGIDDSGRQKVPLIGRIVATTGARGRRKKSVTAVKSKAKTAPPAAPEKKAATKKIAQSQAQPKKAVRKKASPSEKSPSKQPIVVAKAPKTAAETKSVPPQQPPKSPKVAPRTGMLVKSVPSTPAPVHRSNGATQSPRAQQADPMAEVAASKPTPFGMQMTAQAVREALRSVEPQTLQRPSAYEADYVPQTRGAQCKSCRARLDLRKCGSQRCDTMLVPTASRRICAECMFERNTLSMDDFNQRLEEEGRCPHCGEAWQA